MIFHQLVREIHRHLDLLFQIVQDTVVVAAVHLHSAELHQLKEYVSENLFLFQETSNDERTNVYRQQL
jgi:hypothetical protein